MAEESIQWSDSRSQVELLQIIPGSTIEDKDGQKGDVNQLTLDRHFQVIVYDPITLQCVPIHFTSESVLTYSPLHKI